MKCYDLFKLPSLKSLALAAGEDGLGREIRWLRFADNVLPSELPLWTEKHDLVILTGSNLSNDFDLLRSLLPALDQAQIAGILFNTGKFIHELPAHFLQSAARLHLPIFTLPWECRLSDVSKDICNCIFSEQNASNAQSKLLETLLFDDTLSADRREQILQSLDSFFHSDFYVGILRIFPEKGHVSPLKNERTTCVPDKHNLFSANQLLYNQFQTQMQAYQASLICVQRQDALIFTVDAQILEHPDFSDRLQSLHAAIRQYAPHARLAMGASRRYTGVKNCKQAYQESCRAAKTAFAQNRSSLLFFDQMGMFRLLTGIQDVQELRTYYQSILQPVIAYDTANHTDLLSTLLCYLDHKQQLPETAEALFIHKNTLKYRLNKLEALLEADFSDPAFIAEVMLAYSIGILLDLSK